MVGSAGRYASRDSGPRPCIAPRTTTSATGTPIRARPARVVVVTVGRTSVWLVVVMQGPSASVERCTQRGGAGQGGQTAPKQPSRLGAPDGDVDARDVSIVAEPRWSGQRIRLRT